jgi:hypothetical protein
MAGDPFQNRPEDAFPPAKAVTTHAIGRHVYQPGRSARTYRAELREERPKGTNRWTTGDKHLRSVGARDRSGGQRAGRKAERQAGTDTARLGGRGNSGRADGGNPHDRVPSERSLQGTSTAAMRLHATTDRVAPADQ